MPNTRLKRTVACATLSTFMGIYTTFPIQAKAEDNSFFDDDFASQPGGELPTPTPNPRAKKTAPPLKPTSVAGIIAPDQKKRIEEAARSVGDEAREMKKDGRLGAKPTPVPPNGKQTIEIVEVGAILDGSKTRILNDQITDLVALTDGKKRKISVIYVVGGDDSVPVSLRLEVLKRGGQIRNVRELPEKYSGVKLSPTWILAGAHQEILIEGSGEIRDNLTPEGAIITRATEKVTPLAVSSSRPSRPQP